MKNRAQVLILSMWILIILTILAIGIGHRVSMALRLSRSHRDKLKARYLTKVGINRLVVELDNDSNDFDALNEDWANNEKLFSKILASDNQNEFAQVSYTVIEGKDKRVIYGVRDEERKININTATKEVLISLFEEQGINNATEKVTNLLI
ncbi:MAG: hypothetical protein NC916_03310, partial [Candidatus Omnitrophica bacterium]|nr:hypothetical protein [Candidatus Omnitrophota bacterium]